MTIRPCKQAFIMNKAKQTKIVKKYFARMSFEIQNGNITLAS
jgi:hypothetical protein